MDANICTTIAHAVAVEKGIGEDMPPGGAAFKTEECRTKGGRKKEGRIPDVVDAGLQRCPFCFEGGGLRRKHQSEEGRCHAHQSFGPSEGSHRHRGIRLSRVCSNSLAWLCSRSQAI